MRRLARVTPGADRPLDGVQGGKMTDCRRRVDQALASTMPFVGLRYFALGQHGWTACRCCVVKDWKPNTVCSSTRCSRRVCSLAVLVPANAPTFELVGDLTQHRWGTVARRRAMITPGKAQVVELHGEA